MWLRLVCLPVRFMLAASWFLSFLAWSRGGSPCVAWHGLVPPAPASYVRQLPWALGSHYSVTLPLVNDQVNNKGMLPGCLCGDSLGGFLISPSCLEWLRMTHIIDAAVRVCQAPLHASTQDTPRWDPLLDPPPLPPCPTAVIVSAENAIVMFPSSPSALQSCATLRATETVRAAPPLAAPPLAAPPLLDWSGLEWIGWPAPDLRRTYHATTGLPSPKHAGWCAHTLHMHGGHQPVTQQHHTWYKAARFVVAFPTKSPPTTNHQPGVGLWQPSHWHIQRRTPPRYRTSRYGSLYPTPTTPTCDHYSPRQRRARGRSMRRRVGTA